MSNLKLIVVSCLLIFGVHINAISQYNINDTVSDFTVVDVHGNTHNLFSYLDDNKYVCIDFFGISCEQCLTLVPTFNNIFTSYGCNKSDLVFLAINYFNSDDEVLSFEEEYGGIYPSVSGMGGGQSVFEDWQINYWPQLWLISPDKTLVSNISPIKKENIDSVFNSFGIKKDSCPTSNIPIQSFSKNTFTIYPNPASDIIYINSFGYSSYNNYKIYNLSGLIVANGILTNKKTIQISKLKSGFYILEFSQDEISIKQTFIKE